MAVVFGAEVGRKIVKNQFGLVLPSGYVGFGVGWFVVDGAYGEVWAGFL